MTCETEYLYGDSTPSPLKTDVISLLRDAVDFSVDVLVHQAGATDALEMAARVSSRAEKEIERAMKLSAELSSVLQRADVGDDDGPTARCASRIGETIRGVLSAETDAERALVSTAAGRASRAAASARAACAKALENLLLRRPLPDATTAITLRVDKERYVATLRGHTPYGLFFTLELDIAPPHALSQLLRIEHLVERLEIRAPGAVGWVRKEVRIRPQRLDQFYVVELFVDASSTVLKLRTTPSMWSSGFDLAFLPAPSRVELVRILEGELAPEGPHVIEGEDLARLQLLRDSLVPTLLELADHPRSLIEASLDDNPVDTLEAPRLLVERLLGSLGPTADAIAKRSLVPGELVLKRVVGDSHREEVFVSKAELRERIRVLPQSLWSAFDPLNLWEDASLSSAAAPIHAEPSVFPETTAFAGSPEPRNDPPPPVTVWTGTPQPPGAGNRRSAFGAESTGKWPSLRPAFQK